MQEQSIREWAATHGHELVAILRDEGVSGTREAADRPGLSEALSLVEDGEAQGVVVPRIDRLARTLGGAGGHPRQGLVDGKPRLLGGHRRGDGGRLRRSDEAALRQMVGVFAQMERGMIAARLRAGRRRKHAEGGYAYGGPPYGFRAERGALVPVPHEQAIVCRMSELRAEGLSYRAIAVRLDLEGTRPRRGSRWDASTIGRILGRLEKTAALVA